MIKELISTVLQILVFAFVPFLVYAIKNRTWKGFWNYIGLKKSTRKANVLALLVMLLIALPVLLLPHFSQEFFDIMTSPESVTGKIRNMEFGFETLTIIGLIAILKTALAEEVFFRGFLAKRLIDVTNFQIGNSIQAVLFGFIHAAIFSSITSNLFYLFIIFLFPALAAYIMAYLNEKLANGSIIPSWIAHASANLISYTYIAFLI